MLVSLELAGHGYGAPSHWLTVRVVLLTSSSPSSPGAFHQHQHGRMARWRRNHLTLPAPIIVSGFKHRFFAGVPSPPFPSRTAVASPPPRVEGSGRVRSREQKGDIRVYRPDTDRCEVPRPEAFGRVLLVLCSERSSNLNKRTIAHEGRHVGDKNKRQHLCIRQEHFLPCLCSRGATRRVRASSWKRFVVVGLNRASSIFLHFCSIHSCCSEARTPSMSLTGKLPSQAVGFLSIALTLKIEIK